MATNHIGESEYLFNDTALQLTGKFFNIEDVSMLKVGTYGYITSLASHIMRDTTYHRDMLYNEFFLTKANLNSTLYNWAKMLDYPLELASPARIPISLRLEINSLIALSEPSVVNNKIRTITLSKDTRFVLGGFNFLLPYSVQLNIFRNADGRYTVTGFYNFDEINYKAPEVSSPVLKILTENLDGKTYVNIEMMIYQLRKDEFIYSLMSNDILDISIIEQNFGGNLVSFNALYSPNDNGYGSTFNYLEKIFNDLKNPTKENYIFYTFIGDDTIRVYFDSKPRGFRPAYNSKLKLEFFTTEAEQANFNFNGQITLIDNRFGREDYAIIPLSNKTLGGRNVGKFVDNKLALMEQLSTRNNFTTSYDLQNFLKKVRRDLGSEVNEFKVVRTRDDILRRQFTTYMLVRDADKNVVPTNTIDLELSLSDLEVSNFSLKPGTLVVYDRQQAKYRLLDENELPEVYLQDSNSYLYCIPYLMNLNFTEAPRVNTYLTHYEKNIDLHYTFYNVNSVSELVVNSYTVRRNPINDYNFFTISCAVNTPASVLSLLKIRCFIMKHNRPIAYADLAQENSTNTFSLKVNTTDSFSATGRYIIESTFKDINTNKTISRFELDNDYTLKFSVMSKDLDGSFITTKPALYNRMTDIDNYDIICELESNEKIYFADDLSDIMYQQMTILHEKGKVLIRKVPLIGALFYLNDFQNTYIMNDVYSNLQMIRHIVDRLENNTSIDIKFFNTSGISRYFDIDTIDLRVKFTVVLNQTLTKDLSASIEADVVQFIEDSNDKYDKRFSISNLISFLEGKYKEIRYIKIYTINNSSIQSIEETNFSNRGLDDLPYDYVPEFLTVRKLIAKSDSRKDFSYDISITYE